MNLTEQQKHAIEILNEAEAKLQDIGIDAFLDIPNCSLFKTGNNKIVSFIIEVCDILGLEVKHVISKSRKTELVRCRIICCILLRDYFRLDTMAIGNALGHGDHSIVLYFLKTGKKMILEKQQPIFDEYTLVAKSVLK